MFAYYCSHGAILHSVINMDLDIASCLHIITHMDLDMAPCLHIIARHGYRYDSMDLHICYFKFIIPGLVGTDLVIAHTDLLHDSMSASLI